MVRVLAVRCAAKTRLLRKVQDLSRHHSLANWQKGEWRRCPQAGGFTWDADLSPHYERIGVEALVFRHRPTAQEVSSQENTLRGMVTTPLKGLPVVESFPTIA